MRAINTPADLEGLKIRTPSSEWRVAKFKEWGANPTPMSFSEVFVALQTGTMDGPENPLTNIVGANFQEVQKHLSLTGHVYSPTYLTTGSDTWSGLSSDVQTAVTDVAASVQDWSLAEGETADNELVAKCRYVRTLRRPPDTATPEDLRAYQLKMTQDGVSASTFNVRIISLRFFFGITCGRDEMKRFMQFHRKPHKLPIVLSVEEVADLMAAVPGPGLKYRAALGISYGAGLRASEVCNLKVKDVDSDRMLIHVDDGKGGRDRNAMLSPSLLDLLRDYWRESRPEGWLFPGKPKISPLSPR